MSEIKLKEKPEELIQAEKFIVEGKFEEAQQLMEKFKKRGQFSLKDTLSCNLLKINIMIQQGLYEDAIKLANQTYNESSGLRENLLAFDALNLETKALFWLYRSDEALDKIKEGEELLNVIKQEFLGDHKLRESAIEYLKTWFYILMNDGDKADKHAEFCLTLRKELNNKQELAEALISSWVVYALLKGDLDHALHNVEQGLALAKEINWKYFIAVGFQCMGNIFTLKGDINQGIIYHEQSLNIVKKLNNKRMMAGILNDIGNAYTLIGDLNRSSEYLEQGLTLSREWGYDRNTIILLITIITNLIEKSDLERAKQYLYDLEQIKIDSKDKYTDRWYRFCKALLLKTNLRASYRGEAEVIFKQILDEKVDDYELNVWTLLNLCELLLIEVRMLNDLEVLAELENLIAQLLDIAEKTHSYRLLIETYFLKGKLALLTLDMKEARKSLTQAQRIAERWGYNQLATKISLEHDKLRNQLSIWDGLKEQEISLSERIKLAGMDEQLEHLLRNRANLTTQIKEEQITVHKERKICIVCKGDILGYMYACNCDALYCEKCARALTDIENVCWVCNTPIDTTKPIKLYKKDELEEKDATKDTYKRPKKDDVIPKK